MQGRVLIVAGSDSGGGAGIQADIKTVTMLNGFAMTAITALTAQNTLGVHGVYPVPTSFVTDQMSCVLEDLGADAIKTGMLGAPDVVEAIVHTLASRAPDVPLVVDPVMRAKGGAALIDDATTEALKTVLLPRAHMITPNIPEAEVLSGRAIQTPDDMRAAADVILAMGPRAVLMKGGHLEGDDLVDILVTQSGETWRFEGHRVATQHTHGTGCTMAAAIATGLAQTMSFADAVARANTYVQHAIKSAPGYGTGHGPLNHAHPLN